MKKSLLTAVCLILSGLLFAVPAFAAQTIADFESGNVTPNNMGGNVGMMSGDGAHDTVATIVTTPVQQGTNALSLAYTNTADSTWSGMYQFMSATSGGYFDASTYETLKVWVRGAIGGETFTIEMQDGSINAAVTLASISGFSGGLTTGWQELSIPLTNFTGLNRAHITQMNIVFSTLGTGTVYIDDARFVEAVSGGGGSSSSLTLADYESGVFSPNNLGGTDGTMSGDGAHDPVATITTTNPQEGINALSLVYTNTADSTWSGIYQFMSATSGGYLDASSYDTVKIWVRGASGGETFDIEMQDGSINAAVSLTSISGFSGGLTTGWQEVSIPLSNFTGLNVAHVTQMNIVFKALGTGTVYFDNSRFTGPETPTSDGSTSVTVTVKNYTVSVEVTGTVNIGQLIVGTTGYSPAAVTVRNNGNVTESFWLSLTNPSGWTSASTQGNNQFVLMGAFDTAGGSSFAWSNVEHVLTTTPAKSSETRFAGSETGLGVEIDTTRNLWFAFAAPTQTSVETAQVIPVTITASIE
ncbi:MAG: carbohydrate binding domain-containing protein [Elusimicrobiota bacterium]